MSCINVNDALDHIIRMFPEMARQGFMKKRMLDPSDTYPDACQEPSTTKHSPKHTPETYPNPNMPF